MRVFLVAALFAVAVFAGCLDSSPSTIPTEEAGDEKPEAFSLEGHREFCASEAGCDFWDEQYHQYVVYDLDTTVIDVVLVPPTGPMALDSLAAQRLAVQQWKDGITELAQPWFRDNYTINVYAVGVDVPSISAVQDPEIIVISSAARNIVGIGLEPAQIACLLVGGPMIEYYGGHMHGDSSIFAANCTGTGFTCFAINVGDLDFIRLYDLVAHEVGHCLGAGHVGDALDFKARYAPVDDIMSYQHNATRVHCVSNMNVRVLEGVYAHLLDIPEEDQVRLPRGSYYDFDPALYQSAVCKNP